MKTPIASGLIVLASLITSLAQAVEIRKALQAEDLKRRLYEAKQLIEANSK